MHVNNYIKLLTEIPENGISAVLELNQSGASIPFIARYRKEQTGGLNEVEIEAILDGASDYEEIEKRKVYIQKTIEEHGALTPELKSKIEQCYDKNVLEDLYLPFKRKKQTKAELAKKSGLLGLAKLLMSQKHNDPIYLAESFIKGTISSTDQAIEGAEAIIGEWIFENIVVREKLRTSFLNHSILSSKRIKDAVDSDKKYQNYYEFSEPIHKCPAYRLLGILRGENEKILKVKLRPNSEYDLDWLKRFYLKSNNGTSQIIESVIEKNVS